MAKKDKAASAAEETTGAEELAAAPAADEAPAAVQDALVADVATPKANTPDGLVRCTVLHGTYLAERVYVAGETVLVPADELSKLLHCMQPVE